MKNYFQSLTERERLMLVAGGLIVVMLLVYLLVIGPLMRHQASSARTLASEKSRYDRVSHMIATLKSQKAGASSVQKVEVKSIRSAVTETARSQGINISRLQPGIDGLLGVWFNDVSGGDFFVWLTSLETRYGIKAQKISLNPNRDKKSLRAQVSFVEEQ